MTPDTIILDAAEIGGPGRPDPAACAVLAVRLLSEAAAPLPLSSITVEMASGKLAAGAPLNCTVRIDKKTRTVAFTTLEARCENALVFAARALFTAGE